MLPEVTVEASYGQRYNPNPVTSGLESAAVTGRVNVPLYEGGETKARVRAAKHTHVSRIQEIEQARTETQSLVVTAWSRLSGLTRPAGNRRHPGRRSQDRSRRRP